MPTGLFIGGTAMIAATLLGMTIYLFRSKYISTQVEKPRFKKNMYTM